MGVEKNLVEVKEMEEVEEEEGEGLVEEHLGQEWEAQRAQVGLESSSNLRDWEAKCSGEVSDLMVTSISGKRLPTISSLGARLGLNEIL